ncbi:MAG: hypothetical protein Q7K29_00480 [Thermoleophilia bacterium]|nr:hypothetical protein [Thermoleophilia bacterium]
METVKSTVIEVPWPETGEPRLKVSVGGCRLKISAVDGDAWVSGTYEDPTGGLESKVDDQGGGSVRITQSGKISRLKNPFAGAPRMELQLGKSRPFGLIIETGASEATVELGGLPLKRLAIKQGAGRCDLDFSEPNPEEIDEFDVDSGASTLIMRNLANANFTSMTIDGGAATYDLDFGGTLRRDGEVRMSAGVAAVTISVPAATAAKITPGSVLGSLNIGDDLTRKEGGFWTENALAGLKPVLYIVPSVALGTLNLKVT